jgi:hypothetical protein
MAMSTDKRLTIAAVVLVVLGGALYLQKRAQKQEEASYTLQSGSMQLPKFGISEADAKAIDQITIQQPSNDAGVGAKVVLKKEGDEWKLIEPVKAKANTSNVDGLLDNLKSLALTEVVSDSADSYTQYGVSDTTALHVVANKGADVVADLYFGHGGSRGQMVRIAGKTGVFGIKGYSSYIYTREAKQWRDMQLLKFDDKQVKSVEIDNEHGAFVFTKAAEKDAKPAEGSDKKTTWEGKFRKGKAGALAPIARFESSKVEDMLRAYKDLNALDYAQNKTPVDTGLDTPTATLTVTLDDGARRVLKLGKAGESSNRWATTEGNSEAFTISSYAADWVTSNVDKYQKPEEKKDEKKK